MLRSLSPTLSGFGLLLALALLPQDAGAANARCGGQADTCDCGMATPCWCCDDQGNFGESCGNCVWWAWHEACCNWGRGLPWCTNAENWDDRARQNGYPMGAAPRDQSIFVCEPSGSCSQWGHVGWVTRAFPDGSFDSTEMSCGGPCGVLSRHRNAGFATGGFIYDPDGGQEPQNDDAAFVSETLPDGSQVDAGSRVTKRWTVRNTGDTTWTAGGNYLWAFDGDERFGAAEQTQLGGGESVGPGGQKEWSVELTMPQEPGHYRGYWRMDRFGVHRFGQRCWVDVEVVAGDPDRDGDGSPASRDCDDGDAARTPGRAEDCDGKDNNCDGLVDESLSRDCGNGCGPGQERCEDGRWTGCTAPTPRSEECNGRDDDCDDATDEDLRRPCVRVCGDGEERCEAGQWVGCTAREPSREECNGLDDDCDGATDEDLLLECESPCGSGARRCAEGAWQACSARQPSEETCSNGQDEDCDGQVDEGCVCEDGAQQFCGPDRGACVPGLQTCASGRWGECTGARGPAAEACNQRDDDCDGFTDEGLECGGEASPDLGPPAEGEGEGEGEGAGDAGPAARPRESLSTSSGCQQSVAPPVWSAAWRVMESLARRR